MEQIENALMDAYLQALRIWPFNEMPENPSGWIYKVAQRKLLDELKRKHHGNLVLDGIDYADFDQLEDLDLVEVKYPELKLLFTICHPKLQEQDQLAFMLKSISGFGIREIANALLSSESKIKKRLQRARKFLIENAVKFDWPSLGELKQRRETVHKSLYLLFNEGFYSSGGQSAVRKEFCVEAMRLCKYLCDHNLGNHDSFALMSIMCYHISRFDSRIDQEGELISIRNQDRSRWDQYFIKLGHHFLEKSADNNESKSVYQIEAAIGSHHCTADSIERTNWAILEILYRRLHQIKQTDLVLLNYIVVLIMSGKLNEAQTIFEKFDETSFKNKRVLYYQVGAELYKKLEDDFKAKMWIEKSKQIKSSKLKIIKNEN